MYYELYIDVFFLVNFMMDYLLLLTVSRILKCSATHRNIFVGSLVGSLFVCFVMAVPIHNAFLKWILFHIAGSAILIRLGLGVQKFREGLRAFFGLYLGGILLGGVFTFLHQYVRIGSLFFLLAIISYHIVKAAWSFVVLLQRYQKSHCKVTLCFEGKMCTLDAIIDTGNSLRDPVTDRPVCVVEENRIREFISGETISTLRRIGFCSIGKEQGEIPVFQLEKMCVHGEKECWIDAPVIGVYSGRIASGGNYVMLLNPDIF